jgi:penicillin-binding protein 2
MPDKLLKWRHISRLRQEQRLSWQERLAKAESLIPKSRVRIWPFVVGTLLTGLLLFGRLLQLTIVEGTYQRQQADYNRVLGVRKTAPRGVFLDRQGETLVRNLPTYKRQVPGTTVIQGQFEEITREEAVRLSQIPGERVFFDISREYLCGQACAGILGYLSEIDQTELSLRSGNYILGDKIGKMGLEKQYEAELRGQPGSEMLEVDAAGMLVREVGIVDPVPGIDLKLTLDLGLQQKLYELLDNRPGAAVAQIPQTGEVLALVSSPSFDPSNLVDALKAPGSPFFNRAISGAYPPGSVFKVVTAAAALEEGKISRQTVFDDTGEIVIGEYRFGNWLYDQYGGTDGSVNVVRAMQRSNDIFFYHIGGLVGAEKINEWARVFGYETISALALPGEVTGLIPDPAWKIKNVGERWFLGNTYHMSIGQGDVAATPLQVNRMMGAVAGKGVLCDPLLLSNQVGTKSCRQLNLKEETLKLLTEGLIAACEPGGTAPPFFSFEPKVACKTGTAEHSGSKSKELPHAWFTVYAPAENPEIVLTVMLEKAGQGSEQAAPVAKEALDYWFHQRNQ